MPPIRFGTLCFLVYPPQKKNSDSYSHNIRRCDITGPDGKVTIQAACMVLGSTMPYTYNSPLTAKISCRTRLGSNSGCFR
jgi:hypothetical protein